MSVDISALLSPVSKMSELQYQIEKNALNEISVAVFKHGEYAKNQNNVLIKQLELQIHRLAGIIEQEEKFVQDDEKMVLTGAITKLDYKKSVFEYESKLVLLENLNDSLWFHKFLSMFY